MASIDAKRVFSFLTGPRRLVKIMCNRCESCAATAANRVVQRGQRMCSKGVVGVCHLSQQGVSCCTTPARLAECPRPAARPAALDVRPCSFSCCLATCLARLALWWCLSDCSGGRDVWRVEVGGQFGDLFRCERKQCGCLPSDVFVVLRRAALHHAAPFRSWAASRRRVAIGRFSASTFRT